VGGRYPRHLNQVYQDQVRPRNRMPACIARPGAMLASRDHADLTDLGLIQPT
jgi:hypothetical protein